MAASRKRSTMLTESEEAELIAAYQGRRCQKALDRLVLAFQPLCKRQAQMAALRGGGLQNLGDLIQEATIGLIQAIEHFDAESNPGVRLSGFALKYIRSAIHEHLMRMSGPCRVGSNQADKKLYYNFRRERELYEQTTGRSFDDQGRRTVAEKLGVSIDAVLRMEPRLSGGDLSIDSTLGHGQYGERDENLSLSRLLVDERGDPLDHIQTRFDRERAHELLDAAMSRLSAKERSVIEAYFWAGGDTDQDTMSLAEIGAHLNLSKKRVMEIRDDALQRLRHALDERGIGFKDLVEAAV